MSLDSNTVKDRINKILRVPDADPLIITAFANRYDTVGQLDASLYGLAPVIVHPIVGLYQIVFGRTPDDDGLAYWVGRLTADAIVPSDNTAIKAIAEEFATSLEWRELTKDKTNTEIVTALYEQALDRAPDQSGLDYWVEELTNGRSPADLILDFANSDEFINKTTPHIEGFLRGNDTDLPASELPGSDSLFDVPPFDRTVAKPLDYVAVKERIADILRFDASFHLVDTFSERYASLDELDAALLDFAAVTVTPVIGLYQAAFGRIPDEDGLTFWRGRLGDAGVELFDLGNLHKIARDFVASEEWQAKVEDLDPEGIVELIYQQALGRDSDPEGLASWTAELENDPFAAADLLLKFILSDEFIESAAPHFDTLLLSVVYDVFPETGSLFSVVPYSIANGVLTLTLADPYTLTETEDGAVLHVLGRNHIISAENLDGLSTIAVPEKIAIDIAAGVLDGRAIAFTGSAGKAGSVNISGVTVTEATVGTAVTVSPDLNAIGLGADAPDVTVNGNVRDWLITHWAALDAAYVSIAGLPGGNAALTGGYDNDTPLPDDVVVPGVETVGEAALLVNTAFVKLAAAYVEYLDAGNAPLTDFIAKASAARSQLIHDNILGNGSDSAINGRDFPDAIEAELRALLPDWVKDRPVVSGNNSDAFNDGHREALAIDWEQGFERPDYVQSFDQETIDVRGIKENGQTHVGTGNTPHNYVIERHEGAGVEVGLKVHLRSGADIPPVGESSDDGIVYFEAPAGAGPLAGWGEPAIWSFDFSVLTGINGQKTTLDDFVFTIQIDIDPSDETDFIVLTLRGEDGNTPWFVEGKDGEEIEILGDNDGNHPFLSQNSINFGYEFIRQSILTDGGEDELYDFGEGQFDIILSAATRGADSVELASTHIQVNVVGAPEEPVVPTTDLII